jgi:hypothetical protein
MNWHNLKDFSMHHAYRLGDSDSPHAPLFTVFRGNIQETLQETLGFLGWKLQRVEETFYPQ